MSVKLVLVLYLSVHGVYKCRVQKKTRDHCNICLMYLRTPPIVMRLVVDTHVSRFVENDKKKKKITRTVGKRRPFQLAVTSVARLSRAAGIECFAVASPLRTRRFR